MPVFDPNVIITYNVDRCKEFIVPVPDWLPCDYFYFCGSCRPAPVDPLHGSFFGRLLRGPVITAMITGICKIRLHLPGNNSLKEKRRIVKSILARVRNQFNISIAETDDLDLWQMATLGISCVSNSNHHADEIISKAIYYIDQNYPELEIVEQETEIISGP